MKLRINRRTRLLAVVALAGLAPPARALTDACEGAGEVTGVVTTDNADASVEGAGAYGRLGDAIAVGHFNDDGILDVAIGAPGRKVNNVNGVGEVYVFFGPLPSILPMPPDPGANELWHVDQADVVITLPGAVAADNGTNLGRALATVPGVPGVTGDALLIGSMDNRAWLVADLFDTGGEVDLSDTPAALPGVWASWERTGGGAFGAVVSYGGDLNGDGDPEILLGEPGFDAVGVNNVGAVWAFTVDTSDAFTDADKLVSVQATTLNKQLGTSVAAGDVDGDGYDDLVIGTIQGDAAPHAVSGGDVRIFRGSAGLTGTLNAGTNAWRILRGVTNDRAGTSLLVAHLDADGNADLATGAVNANSHKGRVYLFGGATIVGAAADSSLSAADETFNEAEASRHFGESLAAGDVDRDGQPELVVGAPGYGSSAPSDGRMRVMELNGSEKGNAAGTPGVRGNLGLAVACGDLNNDGWDDVVAGAPREDTVDEGLVPPLAAADAGMVYIYAGGSPDTQDVATWYTDLDGDTYGDAEVLVCPTFADPSLVPTGGDCDDTNATIHPGAPDIVGDPIDQDCDGQLTCYVDADDDGAALAGAVVEVAADPIKPPCATGDALAGVEPTWDPPPADCDDGDAQVFPGAPTVLANDIDEDCDGLLECHGDADADGFAAVGDIAYLALPACPAPVDCNDADPLIHPGASEVVADGTDQDCDLQESCYTDADGDNWGSEPLTLSADLTCLAGTANPVNGDCNDEDPTIYPGAPWIVGDALDQDCDTLLECDADLDGDAWAAVGDVVLLAEPACPAPLDCDDANPLINPSAVEGVADGVDQNCDALEDCYTDADQDNWGTSPLTTSADLACLAGTTAPLSGDCDDTDAAVYPAAPTVVGNGVDEDCSGLLECHGDSDADGWAAVGDVVDLAAATCPEPTDCNDADPLINPAAVEGVADGVDQNCDAIESCYTDADEDDWGAETVTLSADFACLDGAAAPVDQDCDDEDPTVYPGALFVVGDAVDQDCDELLECHGDADADGWAAVGTIVYLAEPACPEPVDCDDADPSINPGAVEGVADGVDQNCDAIESCYADADEDDWGSSTVTTSPDFNCLDGTAAPVDGDCNDEDPTVHPGAAFIVADAIDQDCDGLLECDADLDDDGWATVGGFELLMADACPEIRFEDCDDTDSAVRRPTVLGDEDHTVWDRRIDLRDAEGTSTGVGAMVALPDLNCDGVGDFAFSDPKLNNGDGAGTGAVYIVAGGSGILNSDVPEDSIRILGQITAETNGSLLGLTLNVAEIIPELGESPTPELLVGGNYKSDAEGSEAGPAVFVYSLESSIVSCQFQPTNDESAHTTFYVQGAIAYSVNRVAVGDIGGTLGQTPSDSIKNEIAFSLMTAGSSRRLYVVSGPLSAYGPGPVDVESLDTTKWWRVDETDSRNQTDLGASLLISDIDGDNSNELLIGAPEVNSKAGAVFVYWGDVLESGTRTTSAGEFDIEVFGSAPQERFGVDLANVGPLDGDAIGLLIGTRAGAVLLDGDQLASIDGNSYDIEIAGASYDYLKFTSPKFSEFMSVALVGDVDRDGRNDFALGSPLMAPSLERYGGVYLVFGAQGLLGRKSSTATLNKYDATLINEPADAGLGRDYVRGATMTWSFPLVGGVNPGEDENMGTKLATLGDVTGDGVPDLGLLSGKRRGVVLPLAGLDSTEQCPVP